MVKAKRLGTVSSQHGRTQIEIECPECSKRYIVYLWSFSGCGKKCQCGIKLG